MIVESFVKILSRRELCDLELLMDGSFHPLSGFVKEKDFYSILENTRLTSGELWPVPIVLTLSPEEKQSLGQRDVILLADHENHVVAEMQVEEIYKPDIEKMIFSLFGTDDDAHPYIQLIKSQADHFCVGGAVKPVKKIFHKDFSNLRQTPDQMKKIIESRGWKKVVAFQTRNPMHKSHFHLTLHALEEAGADARLLIHPVVGVTQPLDVYYQLRVRCYEKLIPYYPEGKVFLAVFPLSMRMAGPKEALWHAIIRKNYGATHFIVGRDHAGPSYKMKDGSSFFNPYDAQNIVAQHADEIGIKPIFSKEIVYIPETGQYLPVDKVPENLTYASISGTQQRQILAEGKQLPEWFTFPDISYMLSQEYDTCMSVNP